MGIKPLAVYVGRFNPLHLGHTQVINSMRNEFPDNMVVIGSCNSPMSIPNLFDYTQRRHLITTLFPTQRVVGMPDYGSDDVWLSHFNDMLRLVLKPEQEVTCFGGSYEDMAFYKDIYNTKILNRYSGNTPKISATEVRDALIESRSLDSYVDKRIQDDVRSMFQHNWRLLRSQR